MTGILASEVTDSGRDYEERKVSPFFADLTQYLQLPLMIAMYGFLIFGVREGRIDLGEPVQFLGSILSLAWLSGVPTLPVSHELMHRRHWLPRRMAQLLATFYGDPNRDIAHVNTHHLELDTPLDSDTPFRGQTMYSFVVSATVGSVMDAAKIEAETLRRKGKSPWHLSNKMYQYVMLLIALPGVVTYFGGAESGLVTIISMLIAYNAGPGNLQKWRKRIKGHENDPLLLIEMLPVKETRDYVEHVMSNYWVFSIRDGQMPQSLASLAKGKYHKYAAYGFDENQSIQLASN